MIRKHLEETDADLARSYIVPVLVGYFSQGVLTKFTDFSASLYPDCVGAQEDSVVALTSSAAKAVDLSTCAGVVAALKVKPLTSYQDALELAHPINSPCQHTLSTLPSNTPSITNTPHQLTL